MIRWFLAVVVGLVLAGCDVATGVDDTAVPLRVPPTFDPPPESAFNRLTPEKVNLGERLFFDPLLSRDRTVSCASCHEPDHAFADPRAQSVGVEGRVGERNSPSLVNVVYETGLFWDAASPSLEAQAFGPLENPDEMDIRLDTLLARLANDASYRMDFEVAFGEGPTPQNFAQALAAYQRTIVSGGSRYDDWLMGQKTALTEAEQRGLALLEGKAGCVDCHSGPRLTNGNLAHNGLALVGADSGRARITADPADFGRFKVPSLRNVTRTAPYMHDGRFVTLDQVLDHYDAGGTGARNQDPRIQPLRLTAQEKADLLAFLNTLTDETIHAGVPH
ncbi:MAG: cytochrome-c peroxidase [Rhodothermales bacterium]